MHHKHRPDLLAGIEQEPAVQRLRWFTKGLYRVVPAGHGVVISDLRMGVDPDYVFGFRVAEIGNPHPRPIVPERVRTERDFGRLREIWERI
jgi:inner membrane protein